MVVVVVVFVDVGGHWEVIANLHGLRGIHPVFTVRK
jgi:hypothetical protein